MAIKIPVFLSAPSTLSAKQNISYEFIKSCLAYENLEGRALGKTDFPETNPLSEVLFIARSCFGGIIAGFQQTWITGGWHKINTPAKKAIKNEILPTPWNQIEAGILFALRKPLLVLREEGVSGGIFDQGMSDNYLIKIDIDNQEAIREGIRSWGSKVRNTYRT